MKMRKLIVLLKNPNTPYAVWQKNKLNQRWDWSENNSEFAPILKQYGLALPLSHWQAELDALEKNEAKFKEVNLDFHKITIRLQLVGQDKNYLLAIHTNKFADSPKVKVDTFNFFDYLENAILEIDQDNNFKTVSRIQNTMPLDESWFLGKNIFDVFELPFAEYLSKLLKNCQNHQLPLQSEFIASTGLAYGINIYKINYHEQVTTKVLILKNISEEKKAAAALKLSLEQFETQYQNIPNPTHSFQYQADKKALVLVAYNQAALRITEGVVAYFVGQTVDEMYVDSPEVVSQVWNCFENKVNLYQKMPFYLKVLDRHFHFNVSYIFVAPDLVMVHTEDITEKWNVEQELKKQQQQQTQLLLDLQKKDRLLSAVAYSTELLLSNDDLIRAIKKGFERICQNVSADFAFLFQNTQDESGAWYSNLLTGWTTTHFTAEDKNQWQRIRVDTVPAEVADCLGQGQIFSTFVRLLPASHLKTLLEKNAIKSVLAIPVVVKNKFWGLIGFDDCVQERVWADDEKAILTAFANSVAAAIERKMYEAELLAAKNAAEEACRAKAQFLANMSHEIRTPMNGVLGLSNLLSNTQLTDKQHLYLENIQVSARSMLGIINDILDFSKIEAHKMELEQIPFDMDELIRHVLHTTSVYAKAKGLSLIYHHPEKPAFQSYFLGAPDKIKQILNNLLCNATKFTEKGTIQLTLRTDCIENDNYAVSITVEDTGIGIPADKLDSIFESFNQGDNSTTRKYGGTGLGLAISKSLALLMGGIIELQSQEGKGSCFTLKINLKSCSPAIAMTKPKLMGDNFQILDKKAHILIVEDNKINMLVIRNYLKNKLPEAVLVEAKDGKEAVELFNNQFVDLVFMDVQLPVLSGYDATLQIRDIEQRQQRQSTPIIGLTAGAMAMDKENCIKAGMNDYISKPFQPAEIDRILEVYI